MGNSLTPLTKQDQSRNRNMANIHNTQMAMENSGKSHITISSKREVEYESNSIISEEDSAFEDFTPRNQRKNKKRIEQFELKTISKKESEEPAKIRGPMANEIITGNRTFRNNEKIDISVAPFNQEDEITPSIKPQKRKTAGNKNLIPIK